MRTPHWRLWALLREALLNAMNPRSRAAICIALAVAAGSTSVAFSASESAQFTHRVQELEDRGSSILTVHSASPHSEVAISRTSCEALARLPEVDRAGLLIDAGSLDIPEIGARTRIFTASTTLFGELATEPGLIGSELNRTGTARTATVAPSQTRRLAAAARQPAGIPTNSAVVFPLPAGTSAGPTCVVSLTRFNEPKALAPLIVGALEARGGPILAPPQLSLTSDPVRDWRSRPGQYLPLALAVLGGIVASIVTLSRSSEFAAYRLSGTDRRDIGILLTAEGLFPAGAYLFSAAVALDVLTVLDADAVSITEQLIWTLSGAAGWSLVAAAGVLRSMFSSPARMTREK